MRPGIRRLFRLPLGSAASIASDVDEELASLIDARVENYLARGLSPDAARREALRRLGTSLDAARRELHHSAETRERQMRVREYADDLVQDIRYAARGLARRPLFTAMIVATLALGIGATTAIFSAVDVLLLRPLPYAHPDQLMKLSLDASNLGGSPGSDQVTWSYPKYRVFRDAQHSFQSAALYQAEPFTLTSDGVQVLTGEIVGATYLRTLGVPVVRGRDLDLSLDNKPGGAREVLVSFACWQHQYDGDPHIVGRTMQLDSALYTVVGVAAPGFNGLTGQAEVFVPITSRVPADLDEAWSHEFNLVARRMPGVSAAQANAAMTVIGARIDRTYPAHALGAAPWGANARPLDAVRVAPIVRRSVLILLGAVVLVLLIACINVANLLVGRATTRRREIAIRQAVGAGRGRLVRLLLGESVLLAALGGTASVAVAWVGARALGVVNPTSALHNPRLGGLGAVSFTSIALDWRALGFALLLSVVVGVAFGLAPALSVTRLSLADTLKSDANADRRRGIRLVGRRSLVAIEVALAMVLLVGSGLMLRSLAKLMSTDRGFDGSNVLTVRLTTIPGSVTRDSLAGYYDQVVARLGAIPGVSAVGLGDCAPLSGGCNATLVSSVDGVAVAQERAPLVGIHWADAEWFHVLRVPLRAGRLFANTDLPQGPRVVVVNDAAARKFFPGVSAVGHRIGVGQAGLGTVQGAEIIGVVGDVRQSADSAAGPEVYTFVHQSPRQRLRILIRTQNDPNAIVPDVRRALHDAAVASPFDELETMKVLTSPATARTRFGAILLGLFAATALSLAILGIYGVMSLAVSARTREIGIRMALGAEQSGVQRLVIREGVALVGAGAVVGLVGALVLTRVLQTLLFGVTPTDPATYVGILIVLGGAAVAASWIPARRASRVDPVTALRAD